MAAMIRISKRVKINSLVAICLWILGSVLLFQERNGKATIVITAILIVAGIFSQIKKEGKVNSQF